MGREPAHRNCADEETQNDKKRLMVDGARTLGRRTWVPAGRRQITASARGTGHELDEGKDDTHLNGV